MSAALNMAALSAIAIAPAEVRAANELHRDPFEPNTRFRSGGGSPASRLLERQRKKNLKAKR